MPEQIHLYALCLNEARMIPYFFAHYADLVDQFIVLDNGSTDGSLDLLRGDERVSVQSFRTARTSFVDQARRLLDSVWKASRGHAAWVMVVEMDEHLSHPDLRDYLESSRQTGVTAIQAIGYEMVAEAFPTAPSALWQQVVHGARSQLYDKLAIFCPDALDDTNYELGRHEAAPVGRVVYEADRRVKLLHYKHLGIDYVCERNALLATGLRADDLAAGWGIHYLRGRAQVAAKISALALRCGLVPGLASAKEAPSALSGEAFRAQVPPPSDVAHFDLSLEEQRQLIEPSGLFDAHAYLQANPDVAESGMDALHHHLLYGWREGRQPGSRFDLNWYRTRYAAFVPRDVNPLLEYILDGERAGRLPSEPGGCKPTVTR